MEIGINMLKLRLLMGHFNFVIYNINWLGSECTFRYKALEGCILLRFCSMFIWCTLLLIDHWSRWWGVRKYAFIFLVMASTRHWISLEIYASYCYVSWPFGARCRWKMGRDSQTALYSLMTGDDETMCNCFVLQEQCCLLSHNSGFRFMWE